MTAEAGSPFAAAGEADPAADTAGIGDVAAAWLGAAWLGAAAGVAGAGAAASEAMIWTVAAVGARASAMADGGGGLVVSEDLDFPIPASDPAAWSALSGASASMGAGPGSVLGARLATSVTG
jgi:hypothetical protein